jgi:pilus assembly protein CpaD
METIMPRRLSLLTAALVACSLPLSPAAADRYNRGVESVHQPVVRRSDYVIDVAPAHLHGADGEQVLQWFTAIDLGYGDRVSIDSSAAGSAAGSADIADLVGRYGLLVSRGAPVTEGVIAPGMLRIVVSRTTASVPGCPDWSQRPQPNFTSSATSNYGCAINSTMAAMIANPEDFISGSTAQGGDAQTATKAIRSWRQAAPTSTGGLKVESVKGGG